MEKSGSHWKDRLGIGASALCAVHCAATPILLAFLPTLQFTEWMASPWFHQVAAVLCVSLVAVSIWPAYRKHKDVRVLSFSGMGLGMILSAAFLLPDHCCSVGAGSQAHDHANCNHDHGPFARFRASLDSSTTTPTDGVALDSSTESEGSQSHEHGFLAAGLSAPIWEWIQPWMTPIGGLLLVVAHALNMRNSFGKHCHSRCKCGPNESDLDLLSVSTAHAA